MGCCLAGCVKLLVYWLWRALLAAIIAMLFARVDAYVERRGLGDSLAGRAWGAYRARTRKGGPDRRSGPSGPTGRTGPGPTGPTEI